MIDFIVNLVHKLGYAGIFLMTFVESTFVPLPAEITLIPAGYLASKGKFDFLTVFIISIIGTVSGALLNYLIAYRYGRTLLAKYGPYVLLTEDKLSKIEYYFQRHGAFSTFIGRLLPGIRHYISFPAGLAKMNLPQFIFYTSLGGGIWMLCLLTIGYVIGHNQEKSNLYATYATIAILVLSLGLTYFYVKYQLKKQKAKKDLEIKVVPESERPEIIDTGIEKHPEIEKEPPIDSANR